MSQFGVQIHRKSRTKNLGNGKRKIKSRDKRRSEVGNYFSSTKFGENDKIKKIRRRGGKKTAILKKALSVNLLTKDGFKKVKIKTISESPDNKNFARQNIITKGTVIITEIGKAVVMNRPGRDGNVNAKLIE